MSEDQETNPNSEPALADAPGSAADPRVENLTSENGNHFNKCVVCNTDLIDHERRWVCKKCRTYNDARWAALSDTEKKTESALASRWVAGDSAVPCGIGWD